MTSSDAAERAGRRAAKNTLVRAVGEIVGKGASLVLFAVLAREVGDSGVGVYVLAFAFVQIATMPIGLGIDMYLTREVSRNRRTASELLGDVVAVKALLAAVVVPVSFGVAFLLGYEAETRLVVYVLTAGLLMDGYARTLYSVFAAYERGELQAASLVAQRVPAAALGIAVLAAGFGVVAVAIAYTAGSAIGLLLAIAFVRRNMPEIGWRLSRARWRSLVSTNVPYAAQDIFGVLLARLDAVLLSVMATQAAVGRYGAAYRLIEATFFLTSSVGTAFFPMYAYLDRKSSPTIGSAFQRSLKLTLALLVPCGVAFGVLAEPICRVVFGAEFEDAADPLRFLAVAVPLMGLITLSTAMIVARADVRRVYPLTAAMVVLNVALNVVLIPPHEEAGAAAAMVATELVFLGVLLSMAARLVGGLRWPKVASPLVAGAAMGGVLAVVSAPLAWALVAGGVAYAAVLLAAERVLAPEDLRFAAGLLRRRRR
jgi:O-antigen/teichoic acid export membrane protein